MRKQRRYIIVADHGDKRFYWCNETGWNPFQEQADIFRDKSERRRMPRFVFGIREEDKGEGKWLRLDDE